MNASLRQAELLRRGLGPACSPAGPWSRWLRWLRWREQPLAWAAGLLAMLFTLGLLLGFQQVVRQSVQQGEARRKAIAMHAEADWRCKALRDRLLREGCLAQLNVSQ